MVPQDGQVIPVVKSVGGGHGVSPRAIDAALSIRVYRTKGQSRRGRRTRVVPYRCIGCALLDTRRCIQPQHSDRRAAFRCQALDGGIWVELEMIAPLLLAQMIQLGCFVCFWINSRDVGAFFVVAVRASQTQVVAIIIPCVPDWHDMIHMKAGKARGLTKTSIFAAAASALPHSILLRFTQTHQSPAATSTSSWPSAWKRSGSC